jgi:hypothetical protein
VQTSKAMYLKSSHSSIVHVVGAPQAWHTKAARKSSSS